MAFTKTDDTNIRTGDFQSMEQIIPRLLGTRLDTNKIISGSIHIVELESGPHNIVVSCEHLVYDRDGNPVPNDNDTGYQTRTRKFRIPLGEEIGE